MIELMNRDENSTGFWIRDDDVLRFCVWVARSTLEPVWRATANVLRDEGREVATMVAALTVASPDPIPDDVVDRLMLDTAARAFGPMDLMRLLASWSADS